MPAYRTHVAVNLFAGLPLSLVALKQTVQLAPTELLCFCGTYIYGTLFLHPDLDLARNVRLFSFKGLLTLPFRPYSYFFHHRGISHMPIVGTLTRLLWLFLFIELFVHRIFPIPWNPAYLWFGLIGLAVADLFHLFLDLSQKERA